MVSLLCNICSFGKFRGSDVLFLICIHKALLPLVCFLLPFCSTISPSSLLLLLCLYLHPSSFSVKRVTWNPLLDSQGGIGVAKGDQYVPEKVFRQVKEATICPLPPPFSSFPSFLFSLSELTRLCGLNTHWHVAYECLKVDWHQTPGTAFWWPNVHLKMLQF